ncbi:MAG: sialate O-acetylesterase, partial [Verrucomicrobiota bacterium]
SNSANHGEERLKARSPLVVNFDGRTWRPCADPQPGASGNGGSFIPALGDLLAERLKVPVAFVTVGIGATSVREWLPAGKTFPHPPTIEARVVKLPSGEWASKGEAYATLVRRMGALGPSGFREVLWHQGESDANQRDKTRTLPGSLYAEHLRLLIDSSRQEIGWNAPWRVAQVSYHTPDDAGSEDIRAAQASLWGKDGVLRGPDSDALRGDLRERSGKGVHFSGPGQRALAKAWADLIAPEGGR